MQYEVGISSFIKICTLISRLSLPDRFNQSRMT